MRDLVHGRVWFEHVSLFNSQKKVRIGRGICGRAMLTDGAVLVDEIIIEYCGEVIKKVESERCEREYTKRGWSDEYMLAIVDTSDIINATVSVPVRGLPTTDVNRSAPTS